jgi:hypothetical protein
MKVLSQHCPEGLRETEKSVRIVSFQAEIQTEYLPNMRVVRYHYTNVLGKTMLFEIMFHTSMTP